MSSDFDNESKENVSEENTGVSRQDIIEIKKMDRAGQLKRSKLIAGIASSILGAVLLFWPGLTMELICQFVGAFLGITGVLTAALYFTQQKDNPFRAASLAAGIPLAVVGLFIFLRPSFLIEFIPIVVGIIILIDGAMNLMETIAIMRQGYDKWWMSLICALITIIFGFILIVRPFSAAATLMRVIGAFVLYNGLSDIFIASQIKNVIKDI